MARNSPFTGRGDALRQVNDGRRGPPSRSELSFEKGLYDGETTFLDDEIGRLRGAVEKADLAGRTSIVFIADHGESFGEHGRYLHNSTLFQEELHVPLIVWAPGRIRPGGRVDAVVRGIDVAPTLAELAGTRWRKAGEARSILPLLEGPEADPRLARSDRDILPSPDRPYQRESSLLAWPWKLIVRHDGQPSRLFNLEKDPGERQDVFARESDVANMLAAALTSGERPENTARPASLDPETVRRLRSLGYIH
jgi:arylsulfatase A-like enzyme